jgi:glycosyltransferase involved in cell wall biosynthesis
MRYAWHQKSAYFAKDHRSFGDRIVSPARDLLLSDLRRWDRTTNQRVSHFIAISRTVQQRIRACYGRSSRIIHPPVDVEYFTPASHVRDDFYLCVSALVPYKRIDLAIAACTRLGRKLVVIGSGPDQRRLRSLAGPTATFLGWQPHEAIRDHYRRCRALLFPGEEDFGIVPVEAQACGAPVIAYNGGGAAETVIPSTDNQQGTGLLFAEQSASSLATAIIEFESGRLQFNQLLARRNAEQYRADRFTQCISAYVDDVLSGSQRDAA